MSRSRLRDLGIAIGQLPPGKFNAITDVPGILVGHRTLIFDTPRIARTGVTVILPRDGEIWRNSAFAGFHSFNGNGEMTGLLWVKESGLLTSAIGLTNTHSVGPVHAGLVAHWAEQGIDDFLLPVVAETCDSWLNDINAFHITADHVQEAIAAARSGAVPEGNVGSGTGMICHEFKGGIGTASRIAETRNGTFTVGALVQANYGERSLLRVDGVPVGEAISADQVPLPWGNQDSPFGGSIIVILATDAPLLPVQCQRMAQRATVGLARVGGIGHDSSGDIFLAIATGNDLPLNSPHAYSLTMLPHRQMDRLFKAAIEATEEAILNALTAAETMTGFRGHTVHALPLDLLQQRMASRA